MAQSLVQLLVHIIFSTKDRAPLISPDIRPRLYPYLGSILQASGCHPLQVGGTDDHLHIACILSKNHPPSQIIEDLKKNSSKWTKGVDRVFEEFYWQRGYGMFAVSPSHLPASSSTTRRSRSRTNSAGSSKSTASSTMNATHGIDERVAATVTPLQG